MAIISFKCPNCGGELIFDPATQKYKCEYCNSLFTQEELDAMKPMQGEEPDAVAQEQAGGERADETAAVEQTAGERESEPEGEAVYYSCPSCGAEIVTDATTAATFCYYCHNPVVLGKVPICRTRSFRSRSAERKPRRSSWILSARRNMCRKHFLTKSRLRV